ncbi:MAG: S-adenosylmethionine decarboxylase [Armatimonadota bacterium]|nr:S-adenosylmethionine decarboxylase [Armatimonadota bacterium]
MHLVIEGRGGDWHKLQDLPALYELLDTLPGRINMTKIMPPIVTRYVGVTPEDWGISGFVMIAESHISVHTFPERGEVSIDVFSCKEFDPAQACDLLAAAFGLQEVETCVLRRGLEYGRETTMLPSHIAKQVTAYTPDVTKPELVGISVEPPMALSGYHPNGYETNGTPLNGHAMN